MSASVIQAAVCCTAILLALAIGYYAGTRRRAPRHGTIQPQKPRHCRKD
jgi:hypothetical protein